MPVTIGSNIASLKIQRRLAEGTDALGKVYERLSSGQRINRASDDAAGLAVASTLNSHARVFTQAIRNLNDGLSLLNVAQGALSSLSSITTRQKELAEQAANGVYSQNQRAALQKEMTALVDEFNRITQTSTFNGINVLDGSAESVRLQGGYGIESSLLVATSDFLERNAGDGTFGAAVSYGVNQARDFSIGDFNEDGFQDIVVQNFAANRQGILLGNGDGTFQANISFVILASAPLTRAIDINGDGHLDLVGYTSNVGGPISVALGAGNGTFSSLTSFDAGNSGVIQFGDFNGDGITDIARADYLINKINIYIGNGNGTFNAASTITTLTGFYSIATGDFNHDGKTDISATSSNLSISTFINQGNGTFAPEVQYAVNPYPIDIVATDVDQDGNLDLVSGLRNSSTIAVLRGTGDGTFLAAREYFVGAAAQPFSVSVADYNLDGIPDIASTTGAGTISLMLGNGDATFKASTTFGSVAGANRVGQADFNSDGVLDIIALNNGGNSPNILLANTHETTSIQYISVMSQEFARQALVTISAVQERVSTQLGSIGASQSRIEVAINALHAAHTGYSEAEARIKDADIAADAAELTRRKILQQAAASVLAQANQEPKLALLLLR